MKCGSASNSARVCTVGLWARLLHLFLTSLVFYVFLSTPSSGISTAITAVNCHVCDHFFVFTELHRQWEKRSAKFVFLVLLLFLSTLFYLAGSLTDPGYCPRRPPKLYELSSDSVMDKVERERKRERSFHGVVVNTLFRAPL